MFLNLKGEYTSKWHSSFKSSFRYDILRLFKFILLHAEQIKTLLNWGPSLLVTNQNAHTDLKISTFCWISLRIWCFCPFRQYFTQTNPTMLFYMELILFKLWDLPEMMYVIEALQYQSDVQDKLYLNITSYPVLIELAHQPVKEFGFRSSITLDTTCQSVKCTLYIRTYNHHHLNKTKWKNVLVPCRASYFSFPY